MKKNFLVLVLMLVVGFSYSQAVYAESFDVVMKQFQTAQQKLRDLRKAGASASEITIQEKRVSELRSKLSELQSQVGI